MKGSVMQPTSIARWSELPNREPRHALVGNVDLVIIRYENDHSVLYGRCLHRGAMMADGRVDGDNLICGLHGWDYGIETGISAYDNAEVLQKFASWVEDDQLLVDADEIAEWERSHPQPYDRDAYQGAFQDVHGAPEEPHVGLIRRLAKEGLEVLGHHGTVTSMGVPRDQLPAWDDIQFVTAQVARRPLLDDGAGDGHDRDRPQRRAPTRTRPPDLRVRHELRRAVGGGEGRPGDGCRSGRHRDLQR